jgi:hypothetical protein
MFSFLKKTLTVAALALNRFAYRRLKTAKAPAPLGFKAHLNGL